VHTGTTDSAAAAATQPQQAGITDLLEEAKGGPLTDSEIDYALANHSRYIDEILGKTDQQERSRLASRLWSCLSVRIKTQTRLAVRGQYLFDSPVPGAFGSAGTEVQFAVRGSSLFCAKTMLETGDLQREHMIATQIHSNQTCPTVMPVLDMIDLPGEPRRIAMVTPYYPTSLAPLANGNLHEEGCVNVALCGLATIKAFHRKGICHGDIKPGNMMLTARSDNVVVTIDFGLAVEYGESLVSVTPQFGLNCPLEGSLKYDLTCLASSLYVICTGEKLYARARGPQRTGWSVSLSVGTARSIDPTTTRALSQFVIFQQTGNRIQIQWAVPWKVANCCSAVVVLVVVGEPTVHRHFL
jgi:Protein kinase domain